MDVLPEILPPNYTAKAEPTARDSSRQQPEEGKKDNASESEKNLQQEVLKVAAKPLLDAERRTGDDRRQQRMKRGRWLESRERNNRRATALKVFVKV